ncbi:MAG: hypothetical protein AAGJ84_11285 [Pseudomonadota bacterium]
MRAAHLFPLNRIRDPYATIIVWGCRAVLALAVVVVVYGSLGPTDPAAVPGWIPWDKAQHFIAFLGLSAIALIAFANVPSLFVGLIVFTLGLVIELVQPAFGRTQSASDVIANLTGILTVLGLVFLAEVRVRLRTAVAKS